MGRLSVKDGFEKIDSTTMKINNWALTETQELILKECDSIAKMLIEKNRKYGNSALEPINVFSKLPPEQGINMRIDDKLKRIKNNQDDDTEDAELDLIGYLILKRVLKK